MKKKIMAICLSLAIALEIHMPTSADVSNAADAVESAKQACAHETKVIDRAVSATCQADGLTEGSHCADCGMVLVQREVVKASDLRHKWIASEAIKEEGTNYVTITKPICALCGAESEESLRFELGDVNQNNAVGLTDVQTVLRFALKIQEMNMAESVLADVNQSGNVDLEDAYLILKKTLHIINNYDDVLVENITLNKDSTFMYIGNALSLIATVYPPIASNSITWSSSNTAVATVSQHGQVQAIRAGTTTITASVGGLEAKCVITVLDNRSPYVINCEKIIDYISQHGSTDSKGRKYIGMTINDYGSTSTITYNPDSQTLLFDYNYYSITESTVSMEIDANEAATGTIYLSYMYSNSVNRSSCIAHAKFNAKSYSYSSMLYFYWTFLMNMKEGEVQYPANSSSRDAFITWNTILYDNLLMKMPDIGFVSFTYPNIPY